MLAATLMVGCTPGPLPAPTSGPSMALNPELHDALPADVLASGHFTVVMPGANPPWWTGAEGEYHGAAAELSRELGEVLGVEVDFVVSTDISAALASVASGRYQMAFAPYGDSSGRPDARQGVEYIDVAQEIVPFLVPEGNPKQITQLDGLCGVTVAAQANGKAYQLLKDQAARCAASGQPALDVLAQTGVPNGVLAVKSGRADAFFSSGAALFYYARQEPDALEVVGTGSDNGFPHLYQGVVMPKGSAMTPLILRAFQAVFANGEYARIMTEHHLEAEAISAPGIDLDKAAA